jgi:hypothetical protein
LRVFEKEKVTITLTFEKEETQIRIHQRAVRERELRGIAQRKRGKDLEWAGRIPSLIPRVFGNTTSRLKKTARQKTMEELEEEVEIEIRSLECQFAGQALQHELVRWRQSELTEENIRESTRTNWKHQAAIADDDASQLLQDPYLRDHAESWKHQAQVAALRAHWLILEDDPESQQE